MEFLNTTSSGKIYPEWDPLKVTNQILWAREAARLKLEYTLEHNSFDSEQSVRGLLELFQELSSEQELR